MKKRTFRSVLSFVCVLALVFGMFSSMPVSKAKADETVPVWEKVEEDFDLSAIGKTAEEAEEITPDYADDESVRVMIVFEEDSAIEAGFDTEEIATDSEAVAYTEQLAETQNEIVETIEEEVLEGESLEQKYSFTVIANAISAEVKYGLLEDIEAVSGVEAVYVMPVYEVCADADIQTATAGDMVGSYATWLSGYTGAGMRVAVIDTGLDIYHPSFAEDAYLYGLEETAKETGKTIADYDLLDKEEISAVIDSLNATAMYPGLTADDVYGTAKLPFCFNYVDADLNVTHSYDDQGDHGTHVSGITTANKYVNNDGSFERQESGVVGVAPDAQLFVMKVFGRNGGAYTDDYMAAIEDAVVLGVDAVNLSLGSSSAGETSETAASQTYINDIFKSLEGTKTVVSISAGNADAWSSETNYGYLWTEDVNVDTVGSPGSYKNAFTVASAVNYGYTGYAAKFQDEVSVLYDDGSEGNNKPMMSLDKTGNGKELEYVLLSSYGKPEDFEGIDVAGKLVLVSRGELNFSAKLDNAAAAGAAAVLIYNNTEGKIGLNLSGSTATIPCASITLEDANTIAEVSEYDEATGTFTGKVVISKKTETVYNVADGYLMSDFSSWGVPGDLTLKPEITAPGGNIYSTLDGGTYGQLSGTSMAAPSITGLSALVLQYIEENDLAQKNNISARTLAQSLLMSTATPLVETDGGEYSPRKQGAGLANANLAISTPAYILVGDKEGNDGKVKAELLDDPDRTGVYSFDFTVYNMNPKKKAFYTFDSTIMTEDTLYDVLTANSSYELSPEVTFETKNEQYMYDIDNNYRIDMTDIRYLLAYANGSYQANVIDCCIDEFDFNGNGAIDTDDVRTFYLGICNPRKSSIDFYKKVLAVRDKAEVKVTVKLSDADRQYIETYFANGQFVEGFIYLDGKVDMSIPMLAFYGNWSDSSMFDNFDFMNWLFGGDEESYLPSVSYTNYMTMKDGLSGQEYVFTSNMYEDDDEYLADRNAMSSLSGDAINNVVLTFIRNAADVKATVTNAETGEVYLSKSFGQAVAAYYSATDQEWKNTKAGVKLGYSGTDAEGNPLPNGTKINISVTALPALCVDETRVPGAGTTFTIPMVIDNEAPIAELSDITTKTVQVEEEVTDPDTGETSSQSVEKEVQVASISVLDDNYVAAVRLVNRRGTELLGSYAVNQTERGEITDLEIECPESVFYVAVLDYAGNVTTYRVNNSGMPDSPYAESVEVSDEYVTLLKGGTYQVSAYVGPDTLVDDSVLWFTYEDIMGEENTVAEVDENGIITGIGEGETLVVAVANAPSESGDSVMGYILVEVIALDVDLNATLWDESGEVFFSGFNTGSLPAFEKLSEAQDAPFWSTAVVGDKLYASTYSSSQEGASLYAIDPENGYSAELINPATYWYTDMGASKFGYIYSTYGPYVIKNDLEGNVIGIVNMSKYTDGYMVGVDVLVSTYSKMYQTNVDLIYAIDEYGNIFEIDYYDGLGYIVNLMDSTGIETNGEWYYDSLHYDDESDFWFYSLYDGSDEVKVYALLETIDWDTEEETFIPYYMGSFPDKVWPVSGLYSWSSAELPEEEAAERVERAESRGLVLEAETEATVLPELTRAVNIK